MRAAVHPPARRALGAVGGDPQHHVAGLERRGLVVGDQRAVVVPRDGLPGAEDGLGRGEGVEMKGIYLLPWKV